MITTAITEGIKITVTSKFRPELSGIDGEVFYFDYQITIENINPFSVQLLRRDWFIYDSLNSPRYISGEGVIGQQPTLVAGEIYQYASGCDLRSEIGYMTGHYTFKNLENGLEFPALIPKFDLISPTKMN
jgi:ApaG protein